MEFKNIKPDKSIALFVKNILVFEDAFRNQQTVLPFFADGYPGLMFQETENGLYVVPHNKKMPYFFLYGQTLKPIELVIKGSYKLIIFQLYPFVLNSFFNIKAKDLNDNCYNLEQINNNAVSGIINQLQIDSIAKNRIKTITTFLYSIFQSKIKTLDFKIMQAIQLILEAQGQLSINKLCVQLHMNERTFERRFLKEVGVSAKQFSSIIKFHKSLVQLSIKDYSKLTDVVYSNGFSDQSHFIRVFKAFTGKTPKKFKH